MSFNVRTDPSSLPIPSGDASKKYFRRVIPTRDVSGTNFVGGAQVEFDFSNSGNTWYIPSESYVNIKLSISDADGATVLGAGTNGATDVSLSWNAAAALFSSGSYRLGDTTVSQVNGKYAQQDALYKRMFSSDAYRSGQGAASFLESDKASREARSAQAITHNLCHKPNALSIFNTSDWIPPTMRHSLNLTVAQNWQYRIMDGDSANKTALTEIGTNATTTYLVTVDKLEFYMACVEGAQGVRSQTAYLDLRDLTTLSKPMTALQEDNQYTVPPSTYRLSYFVQDTDSANGVNGRAPVCHFKGTEGTAVHKNLKQLRMTLGSLVAPSPDYSITWTATSQDGLAKVFQDYDNAAGYDMDEAHEAYDSWRDELGVIVSFPAIRPADERSTDLTISTTYDSSVNDLVQFITAESLSQVALTFNAVGDCEYVERIQR